MHLVMRVVEIVQDVEFVTITQVIAHVSQDIVEEPVRKLRNIIKVLLFYCSKFVFTLYLLSPCSKIS